MLADLIKLLAVIIIPILAVLLMKLIEVFAEWVFTATTKVRNIVLLVLYKDEEHFTNSSE